MISRDELISELSLTAQGRLTTEPTKPVVVGTGNGSDKTFPTPFLRSTTLRGYVNDVLSTSTMSRATGTGGTDQITFSSAPGSSTIVTVAADALAINIDVMDAAIEKAESVVGGAVQSGGYEWPLAVGSAAETAVKPYALALVRWFLRVRRDLEEKEELPLWIETWRRGIARGNEFLPVGTAKAVPPDPSATALIAYGSDTQVFAGKRRL